jgi:hypothetical protein
MRAFTVRDMHKAQALVVREFPTRHAQVIAQQRRAPYANVIRPPVAFVVAPEQALSQQAAHGVGELRLFARRELVVFIGKSEQRHNVPS